jgi:hypothetical protein
MAVASEINKKLNRDINKLLIGTIAPDISKLVGDPKTKTHFSNKNSEDIPEIDRFIKKYKNHLDDDFVMGYYIHLYTDYLWFKYFIDDIDYSSMVTFVDGKKLHCDRDDFLKYVYNDYTNINIKLIDRYNMDLKIFYTDIPIIDYIIDEIPMDKLNVVVNETSKIIANTKINKTYLFNLEHVENFIGFATKIITSNIEKL